jgi:capsular exopolysaccharide synthesis family protein
LPFANALPLEEDSVDLRDYWRVLAKRRWLIATVLLCTVFATALVVLTMTPIYTAETILLIERKAPQAINLEGATSEAQGPDEYDYYRTQYEILKSRGLMTQVIQEQQLESLPLFADQQEPSGLVGGWWSHLWGQISQFFSPQPQSEKNVVEVPLADSTLADAEGLPMAILDGDAVSGLPPELIEKYAKMLEVKPVPRTRLVKITFSTPDPALSARIANTHAQVYIRQGVERRSQTDEEAQGFLEEKLVELRERLEKSEVALNSYRRDQGIISFDEKENVAVDRMVDLNRDLTEAESRRISLETQMPLLRGKNHNELPAVIKNSLIQTLKQQLAQAEAERAQLASQFKDNYPKRVEVEARVAELASRLRKEQARIAQGVISSYQFAVAKEKELRKKMEEQRKEVLRLKDASVKYAILAREVDTNRQLYDSVLQRIKEVGVAAELRDSNISVIDAAEAPVRPSKPRKALSLILSAIVGLMGGVGLAFFLEYLDNRLHTPEEVERHVRLPSLAVIPDFTRMGESEVYAPKPMLNGHGASMVNGHGESSAGKTPFLNGLNGKAHVTRDLVLDYHNFSLVSESYRTLRTALLLSRAEAAPKTLLFTSATEGEGKTATAANTAIVFAQLGMRVLLVDADLRRARCHTILNIQKGIGLTELLIGRRDARQVIKPTVVENLFFLSSGVTPPNPTELISSRKMRETLLTLREEYDCVIIDSPPVMPVSDALLLSTMVDGVVIVVNGQSTPREIVKETRSRLEHVQAKVLGVVLNRVDVQRGGYGYYYGYYSSYHSKNEEESLFENGMQLED